MPDGSAVVEGLGAPPGDWVGRCGTDSGAKPVPGSPPLSAPAALFPGAVIDRASILESTFVRELEDTLAQFHGTTCHQLAVLTVASLEGRSVEDYGLATANQAGFGYAGLNNGLLLLVAPNDRKARIEVGCGLEDVVSDQQAAQIMERDLLPAFRTGAFQDGVRSGMNALMELARRKVVPPEYRPAACTGHR